MNVDIPWVTGKKGVTLLLIVNANYSCLFVVPLSDRGLTAVFCKSEAGAVIAHNLERFGTVWTLI